MLASRLVLSVYTSDGDDDEFLVFISGLFIIYMCYFCNIQFLRNTYFCQEHPLTSYFTADSLLHKILFSSPIPVSPLFFSDAPSSPPLISMQVNYSRQVRPDTKTHLDRPLVVDPRENRNNNTNKTTSNNSEPHSSQHHPTGELHRQTRFHEHGGPLGGGSVGGGGSGPGRPPLERGESTESRRSRKSEHHHHTSRTRLDATVIPGPEERPPRRHHHTRSGSRGGGQSEHRKPRSHRKNAEDEDGGGEAGRHKNKRTDAGGDGGEQTGGGEGSERRPRRSRHGNQSEGEGKRICQHRRKYVQCM